MLLERFSPAGLRTRISRIFVALLKPIYRGLARRVIRDLMLEPEFQAIDKARLRIDVVVCDQIALGRRLARLEDRIEALQRQAERQ